ncbi:hypothetical protein Leryth_012176 [Lithospermum erythrorhizon]|nr:hypothetical protein Leryth_012176 [Lithospermum erythrorhizon]
MNPSQETFNHDEHLMQCSLNFTDSLKDLKNLQEQLYTAAEYFEASYEKDDHKQFVIESFKEYATKALVSTVDHLGSTASKLNDLAEKPRLGNKVYFLALNRKLTFNLIFLFPSVTCSNSAGKIVNADGLFQSVNEKNMSPRTIFPRTTKQAAFQPTRSVSLPLPRKSNDSGPLSTESSPSPTGFSFTTNTSKNKEQGKRSVSPFRLALKRSGSVIMRSNSPSSTRNPSEPQRSVIRSVNPPRSIEQEDLYSKKSRHIFKALLSMHRPRKEGVPSRFGDDR